MDLQDQYIQKNPYYQECSGKSVVPRYGKKNTN